MHEVKFLVLYGSESGTAQDVAERIWKEGKTLGMSGPVVAMDEYNVCQLPSESTVLFVCSTAGQGDPPANMRQFWRFLLRRNLPSNSLENVTFAVLGLGDSSYAKFNHAGKKLFRRLEMLGGRSLLPPGWADDQHDLGQDAVVDPWIEQLKQALVLHHPLLKIPDSLPCATSKWCVTVERNGCGEGDMEADEYSLRWPLSPTATLVRLTSNTRTTPPQHFQEVRLLRFDCPQQSLQYRSGDVAVVRPSNSESSVKALIAALPQINPSDVFNVSQRDPDMPVPPHLASPTTFQQLATHYWDLNAVPRRSALQVLSRLDVERSAECELEREKLEELCSAAGQEEYFSYCTRPRRTTVELLQDFPHTARAVPPGFLFDIFQPIRPRMFSIASPPQSDYVELLVAVVKFKTRLYKTRLGLCSNWLASLAPQDTVQMYIKPGSLDFNKQGALIMVGPGTGVAPFRSYLCSREFAEMSAHPAADPRSEGVKSSTGDTQDGTSSLATLVFGCRNSAADFHFKDDFIDKPGLRLFTAFSRDQPHKIYVQHVISENSSYFGRLIYYEGARVMVAGNSKEMPESVRLALVRSLVQVKPDLTEQQAQAFIEAMETRCLYQTETWS